MAAKNNQPEAIAILVGAGASTHERDAGGGTPLHDASDDLGLESAVALLKHGAVINARDIRDTPADTTDAFRRSTSYNEVGKEQELRRVERVLKLLANATVAREVWRPRGLLVASRARPQMVALRSRIRAHGDWVKVLLGSRAHWEWMELTGRVLRLKQEGAFRTIMGYL
ncbi:unnamed protein product [Ectocarpus sp. 8 AP-2014]